MQIHEIHEVTARGRGEALGVLSRTAIRRFLDDGLAQINHIRPQSLPLGKALALAQYYLASLQQHLPLLAQELEGFAKGADITLAEAMLLQCRRELIGWDEDCTLLAYHDRELGPVIAQTIDLAGNLSEHVYGVRYNNATCDGGSIAIWSHTGLLGYLGINSHGLAIGINMVLAANWQIGIPPYLLVRHLLTLPTLDACFAEIARIPRASSRSLMLAQGERLINVEMTVNEHRLLHGTLLAHSNHYLHPDFQSLDLLGSGTSSHARQARILELAAAQSPLSLNRIRQILADHKDLLPGSICFHRPASTGGQTVSAAILQPKQYLIELCFGPPCSTPFLHISLA